MNSRFILSATAAQDNIKGVATLLLGHDGNTGNRLFGNDAYGPTDGGATNFFGLLEAYIQADLPLASGAVGRQVVVLGNSVIYDDPLDGLRAWGQAGPATIYLTTAKLKENTSAPGVANSPPDTGTTSDADLYILEVMGGDPERLAWNVFVTHLNDRGPNFYFNDPADTQLELSTIGIAVEAPLGPVSYRGEVDFLTGSISNSDGVEPDLQGFNVVLEFGADVGPADVGFTAIYTTGQDEDELAKPDGDINVNGINGNYPVGIIITNIGAISAAPKDGQCLSIDGESLGGAPGCIEGHGLTALKLSGSVMPMDKVTLDAAAIWAQASEDNAAGENAIGIELDGVATYNITDNAHLKAAVGYLIADDFFGDDPDDKLVAVLEASFTFE